MICNTIGLTTDSFETLYVHGGAEVPEVYGGINYAQPIFYSLKTLTGATSYSFMGYPEPLKSYEIGGNMAQNGTPAPTSPIYPQECGDRTGNLAEFQDKTTTIASVEINVEKQKITFSGTSSGSGGRLIPISEDIVLEPGVYNFSTSATGYAPGAILQSKSDSSKYYFSNSWFTLESKETFFISFNLVANRDYYGTVLVMLNAGSEALPYEPYGYKIPINLNGTIRNVYLDAPLRKIGNYADEVNSDGAVTRRIMKLVLTGGETWIKGNFQPSGCYQFYTQKPSGISDIPDWITTHFVKGNTINGSSISAYLSLFPETSILPENATPEDFKAFLAAQYAAGTPVTLWYVLASPTTEQVTAPTITPATGNNTLTIDTTLQPSSVSITGHVKPS